VGWPGQRASIRGTASDAVGMDTSAFCELALGVTQTLEGGAHEEERLRWGRVRRGRGRHQDDGVCVFERGGYETDFAGGERGRRRGVRAWTQTGNGGLLWVSLKRADERLGD
jgi:hypothetical protein